MALAHRVVLSYSYSSSLSSWRSVLCCCSSWSSWLMWKWSEKWNVTTTMPGTTTTTATTTTMTMMKMERMFSAVWGRRRGRRTTHTQGLVFPCVCSLSPVPVPVLLFRILLSNVVLSTCDFLFCCCCCYFLSCFLFVIFMASWFVCHISLSTFGGSVLLLLLLLVSALVCSLD